MTMMMRVLLMGLVLLLTPLAGGNGAAASPTSEAAKVVLPPPGAAWDYQIGGARPVPEGVRVVVRDRAEEPAGEYAVCYVNGFQTQPGEVRFWNSRARRALVLRDGSGEKVADAAWGEWLLDISTASKRKRLTAVMSRWVRGCADKGYQAVEFDNLDSYTRSGGLLTQRHALAYARALTTMTHAAGLAAAQKNTVEMARLRTRTGFDFAIVEECARWVECETFADAFEDRAFIVEYRIRDWRRACQMVGGRVSVILRDLMVTPQGPSQRC